MRYLSREEYDRLIEAAKQVRTSPYLVEKIVLAAHTGLRRGSLFNLRWEQIDFANRVMRIPRTCHSVSPRRRSSEGAAIKTRGGRKCTVAARGSHLLWRHLRAHAP